MEKTIQQRKPMVWCNLKSYYGREQEVLYWEGTESEFKVKMSNVYINFPLSKRNVLTTSIENFGQLQDDQEITLAMKLSHLTDTQKGDVKALIKRMKTNIGREPSPSEVDSIISYVVYGPPKEENTLQPISFEERLKIILRIRKQKIAKIVFGDLLFFEKSFSK